MMVCENARCCAAWRIEIRRSTIAELKFEIDGRSWGNIYICLLLGGDTLGGGIAS